MTAASPAELIAFPRLAAPPPTLERLLSGLAEPASFAPRTVSLDTLEELHTLMALGPAMAEASPARVLFLSSEAAKARLAASLAPADRDPARLAPACAILAYDRAFAEQLIDFLPGRRPQGSCFDRPGAAAAAARRNGMLQGAYLAVAARALGLEAAFVRNFDRAGVAADFFRGQDAAPLFVARLGYTG
jgi:3-hydroxypropanoate dehydrogenase